MIATYAYKCDGNEVIFSPDTSFWITEIAGEDGLEININETQSAGSIGTTHDASSVSSRDLTVNGLIIGDCEAGKRKLNLTVRPFTDAVLYKTDSNGVKWYLTGEAKTTLHTEDKIAVSAINVNFSKKVPQLRRQQALTDRIGIMPFQFSFHASFPYWRTVETATTVLGGLSPMWFPTPVSTSGSWYISSAKGSVDTDVYNEGNGETEFRLYLKATAQCTNPRLYNLATRTYIQLNKTMTVGESAVISTVSGERGCTYYAEDGSEYNAFADLDIDSDLEMVLKPGSNILRFTAEAGRNNVTATIKAPSGVASNV